MSAPDEPEETPPKRARKPRKSRAGSGVIWSLSLATFLLTIAILVLGERALPLPEWARERIENSVNARIATGRIDLDHMSVSLGRDGIPSVQLRNVRVGDTGGGALAVLNAVQAKVSAGALLQGRLSAERILLDGAQITLRRDTNGQFLFQSASIGGNPVEGQAIPDVLAQLDSALASEALAGVKDVEAQNVVISVEDARTGRIWQATNARMTIRRTDDGLTLSVASDVFNGTDAVAEVQLSFSFDHDSRDTSLGVRLSGMPARDIAAQSPVLSWLGVLDAPISGAVRVEFDGTSGLSSLAGTLDISAGALHPVDGTEPLNFESARAYFDVDPERQRVNFTDLAVTSDVLALQGQGHTYLAELSSGWPEAFLGQFVINSARFQDYALFEAPLELSDLRTDVRLRLDPFTVDIAQLVLDNNGTPVRAKGRVEATRNGWKIAVDAQSDRIEPETVMQFWPVSVSKGTRGWLKRNVLKGDLNDVSFGVRKNTGEKPEFLMNFDFENGEVKFLSAMPTIKNAAGRASLINQAFTLALHQGDVAPSSGDSLDAAGSVFQVRNTRRKPAIGHINLNASGSIFAALDVANNPPLRIMERAKRGTDIASGTADVLAEISLPLKSGLTRSDVQYEIKAVLSDVTSDSIVLGRVLAASRANLTATSDAIGVSGSMTLDEIPVQIAWAQPLGDGAAEAGSQVSGTVAINAKTIEAFDLPLPRDLLSGSGQGKFTLALKPNALPRLELQSTLRGVGLKLDALNWAKPRSADGGLALTATLGPVPSVEELSLSAPGLSLDGQLSFSDDGSFREADFSQLRVGSWLDASVRLTPRGAGQSPAVSVRSGHLDLRNLPRNAGSGGGGSRSPIDLSLDTLIVSNGIRLAPLIGQIDAGRAGLAGAFEGRVNGRTPIRGTLAPANAGTALRVQSADAGGVLRDANLTPNALGGTLDLVLTPVSGAAPGSYEGQFLLEDIRLANAPIMADLLSAISVVGLLDQLSGPGIRFDTVDGKFSLTPDRLVLREMAAVGASIGISADGVYDLNAKLMDFAGVISPVYFLNGIGGAVSRRGEGLFGFNYRMTGSVEAPNVGVNPLSILTPGFFRNIFRRAPPTE